VRVAVAMLIAALGVAALPAAGGAQASPRSGGSVRIAYFEPICFNPLSQQCHLRNSFPGEVLSLVLAGAFEVGPDFTWRPRLVSHVTVKKQPFTLTYHIRPRARWSDGTPVSAADFVFTHNSIVRHLPSHLRHVHADVRRIRARGPKTVEVVLRTQIGSWHSLFGWVLPRHAFAGEHVTSVWRSGIDNPRTGRPIGSGPFLLARWQRGHQLTLVRNPSYWDRKAHLDRLLLAFRPEGREHDSPFNALIAGELDFVGNVPSREEVERLRRSPRVRIASSSSSRYEHLVFRLGPGGHPALKSRAVRQALAHAIDREALARTLFPGLAPALRRPHDSVVFAPRHIHYRPNWNGYRYRSGAGPREARRLLESAGCRRGADGIYSCAGHKLSLRAVTTAGVPLRQQTFSIIKEQLGRVGIELLPSFVPGPVLFDTLLPSGNFDIGLFAWILGPDPGGVPWSCGGDLNRTGYCNRQVTRNFDRARMILDPRQRARVVNLADAQIGRDVPGLPLYSPPFFVAYKRELRGVAWRPGRLNAEGWWLDR
jgi:peptide/nickel transport system substrate-binding protein